MLDGYRTIRMENPTPAIRRIVLARPEKRNAQSPEMLYEIDDALTRAGGESMPPEAAAIQTAVGPGSADAPVP